MIKKHNPEFIRQDARNIKSLKIAWRKPRGMHSKVRMSILGHRPMVKIGYRNPAIIRNTHRNLPLFHIANNNQLEAAPQPAAIIISASLGMKKKEAIIKRALERKLTIINLKPELLLEKIKSQQQKPAAKEVLKQPPKESQKERPKETQKEETQREKSQPQAITSHHPQLLSEKEAEKKLAAEKRKILEKPK